MPANPEPKSFAGTSGRVVDAIGINLNATERVEVVEVRGDRIGHVTTERLDTPILEKDWTDAEEIYYEDAAHIYNGDYVRQEAGAKSLRLQKYRHVYTRFAARYDYKPSGIVGRRTYIPDMRWQNDTPLLEGWNYTVDPPVRLESDVDGPRQPIRSIYRLDLDPDQSGEDYSYAYGDEITANDSYKEIFGAGKLANVTIQPRTDTFGLILKPHVAPHYQALGEIDAADVLDEEIEPRFNYATDIQVTGYYQEDQRVVAIYPQTPAPTGDGLNANRVIIDLGQLAKLDYLQPETIVGLKIDPQNRMQPELSPSDVVVLQDDTPLLEEIAKLAYTYYMQPRRAWTYRTEVIDHNWLPGQVVIDGSDTIITEVAFDYLKERTTVVTAYANPDFAQIAREGLS